jgi:hypothetical protein
MRYATILLLLLAVPGWSQSSTTTKNDTSGPCSPVTTGSNNNYKMECNIGTEQGAKMLLILNKILKNQLDPTEVMAKLDEIGKDVKKLSREIYSGYDFNGAKREQRPGYMGVTVGEEVTVFQNMMKLQTDRQWEELLIIAEGQIKKTPDWLTPYLLSGVANANLGNKSAAIDRLTFVKEQAAGDRQYADADRILQALSSPAIP